MRAPTIRSLPTGIKWWTATVTQMPTKMQWRTSSAQGILIFSLCAVSCLPVLMPPSARCSTLTKSWKNTVCSRLLPAPIVCMKARTTASLWTTVDWLKSWIPLWICTVEPGWRTLTVETWRVLWWMSCRLWLAYGKPILGWQNCLQTWKIHATPKKWKRFLLTIRSERTFIISSVLLAKRWMWCWMRNRRMQPFRKMNWSSIKTLLSFSPRYAVAWKSVTAMPLITGNMSRWCKIFLIPTSQ